MAENELTYSWALTEAVNRIKPKFKFLQDVIMAGEEIPLPASRLAMDVFSGATGMAGLVRAGMPGKPYTGRTQTLETIINIPEIKCVKTLNWSVESESRTAGIPISTPEGTETVNYADIKEAEILEDLVNATTERKEWMIAQMITGIMSYTSDDLSFTIDYKLPPAHNITAAGTDKWDDPACDPINVVRSQYIPLIVRATGEIPNYLILSDTAANALMRNSAFKEQMKWVNVKGLEAYFSHEASIPGCEVIAKGLLGMDWLVYWGQYTDDSGSVSDYIEDDYIYLIRTGAHMKKYYCPIATSKGMFHVKLYVETYERPLSALKDFQVTSHFIPVCNNMQNIVRVKVI